MVLVRECDQKPNRPVPRPVFRPLTPHYRHREGQVFLRTVVATVAQRITAQVFVVVPDHIVQTYGDTAIILVDDFVVVTRHPPDAPVILDIFPG